MRKFIPPLKVSSLLSLWWEMCCPWWTNLCVYLSVCLVWLYLDVYFGRVSGDLVPATFPYVYTVYWIEDLGKLKRFEMPLVVPLVM